ncbi:hypothetical protein BDN70DRAFT_848342 [Pholiota conissans]|uniref:Zn(2)-C6 fungal-type domain-containing protein n=1 Tax=Pholiota conissans TaxID=109636 RepID=A0A9P6CYD5_9AGAR|nr:hypothetical protein BDN70DRAFT_848342 [Pholiota conissans]
MAYRSHTASPAGSASPSSSSSSPYIHTTPLDAMTSQDDPDSSYSNSNHGTPNHSTTSLPRSLNAGKGGCWTCRVRRKKCDEQREGDSCRTCKRLTIKCLGWGPKRPDWMRDKKNVDAYKASIKAQLSRAGLIRGQPRHNPMQMPAHRTMSSRQSSMPNHAAINAMARNGFDSYQHTVDASFVHTTHSDLLMPALPGASNPTFEHLSRSLEPFDSSNFHYNNNPLPSIPYHHSLDPDQFPLMPPNSATDPLGYTDQWAIAGQPTGQSELIMHYFESVRKVHPLCASDALRDTTYQAIVEEPHGAVTLAICALAELHMKQMRVSQGLEAPNQSSENSHANYLKNEALFSLETNKANNGYRCDNDAIAALHLLSLSQFSGGGSDWETPFDILGQWLIEQNLHVVEDPWTVFHSLSVVKQLYVKVTLWLDVFSSLSVPRPPKYLILWQRLLGEQGIFWANGNELEMPRRLRMDLLTGCPDEAMLAIAEISSLAHWKAAQLRNGCLSYVELIQRGTAIEQQLTRYSTDTTHSPQASLHSSAGAAFTDEERVLVGNIFRETAKLYLHTVLSNSTPGVPEISHGVDVVVRLFSQLTPGEIDRSLIFPICLAGCMTNDSTKRDFFKSRIRSLNENFGNLLPTRRLMEAVWQKRDVGGKEVDVRDTIREQGLKLLLI